MVGTIIAACALTGCSVAIPMGSSSGSSSNSAMWRGAPEDATGSIARPAPKLSRRLDAEDLRRAMAALETALDPQGSGASVHWDNPQSGAKGSFTPSGQAYPVDARVCRAFVAEISAQEDVEKLEGAACREKAADWTLTEVKPHKAGA